MYYKGDNLMGKNEQFWIDELAKRNTLSEGEIPKISEQELNNMEQQFKEQKRQQLKEMAKYLNENNKEQQENNDNQQNEATDEEKIIEELTDALEEVMSNEFLVRGALLTCRFGSHERKLNILKDYGVYVGEKPLAHKLDKVEFENIMSFGVCSSGSKYLKSQSVLLEKEITDEKGNVKKENVRGPACVPCILESWFDTKKKVRVVDNGEKDPTDKYKDGNDASKGYEILTMNSFFICRHGGLIEPLNSGQDLDYEDNKLYSI